MTAQMPIGQIKTSVIVSCSICTAKMQRNLTGLIYEKSESHIEKVKKSIISMACANYTCNICKSILKSL